MFSRELSAATAKPAILAILAQGENYGYGIIAQVKDLSDGKVEWAEGALYPVLHRLERQKLIEATWRKTEAGRRRKYYRLRAKGKKVLALEKSQWSVASDLMNKLWGAPEPCLT
ncbi:MAG: PadR family transcriptional regulator PadR [Thalassolituus oleivorans]|jgi:PadR family transcriptional regulator PadR